MFFIKRHKLPFFAIISIILLSTATEVSAKFSPEINENTFGFEIGATRVIYHHDSPSVSFWIKNDHQYPIIAQAKVLNSDKKSKAPFIITPPVLRVDSEMQTRLRVIPISPPMNKDTEELYWICIKGVPPKGELNDSNQTSKNISQFNINIITNSCIKLISRPNKINMTVKDAVQKIDVKVQGERLEIYNKSPMHINISSAKINSKKIEIPNGYIEPYSNESIRFKVKKGDEMQLSILNDYGAEIIHKITL